MSAVSGEVTPLHALGQLGCAEELNHHHRELVDGDSAAGQELTLMGGVPLAAVGVTEGMTVPVAVGVLRVAPAVVHRDHEPVIGCGADWERQ